MKLYYTKGTCSLAVRIALHEMKLVSEFESVDFATKKQKAMLILRKLILVLPEILAGFNTAISEFPPRLSTAAKLLIDYYNNDICIPYLFLCCY